MNKDEKARIIEKADLTLKLLNQLELELAHWIASKRDEVINLRREALKNEIEGKKG